MYRRARSLIIILVSLLAAAHTLAEIVLENSSNIAVTQDDIERYILENVPPERRAVILNRAGIFREIAESVYIIRSLVAEAEAMPGFDKTQAAWAAKMKHQRRLVSEYRTEFVRNELKDVDWEAAAREEYTVNPGSYSSPEAVRASHILISTDARSDEAALQLASELRDRVVAGEDFATLASANTDDPSGKGNGGDLGFFERGKMVKSFEDTAFAMRETGAVSEPVKSPFGYHIILFVARKPGGPLPFADVKGKIIDEVQTKMGNQVWQDKIIATRSATDIKLDVERLQETELKYMESTKSE